MRRRMYVSNTARDIAFSDLNDILMAARLTRLFISRLAPLQRAGAGL